MNKQLIIFNPSIEDGGVEKNLFLISNFLIKKINNISIITISNKFENKFHKKIKLIFFRNNFFYYFSWVFGWFPRYISIANLIYWTLFTFWIFW